jgi:hypothetical protein
MRAAFLLTCGAEGRILILDIINELVRLDAARAERRPFPTRAPVGHSPNLLIGLQIPAPPEVDLWERM